MLKSLIAFFLLAVATLSFYFFSPSFKHINRSLSSTAQQLFDNKKTAKQQALSDLKKKKENLKTLSPSQLMATLKEAQNLPKPKRLQVLRTTAKRFIPDSLLFYLAGNIVSISDHSVGLSDVDNPRFFQTEIDSVLDPVGGVHFFTFIFFNQMYAAWSQKKIQTGAASAALSKFLKSSANTFAGMAVAGLGASIVSDFGSMVYHCSLNTLQKVQNKQASDIFATPKAHFAACDDLYLRFVSGKMQSAWINDLILGLIPAAVLSHGVSATAKGAFKKIKNLNRWLALAEASKSQSLNIVKKGKFAAHLAKAVSGAKLLASSTWTGALVNFSLFVGIERLLMRPVTEWGSKKINLNFLNSYKKTIANYMQVYLSKSWKLAEPDKTVTDFTNLKQCNTKECIKNYYKNLDQKPSKKMFLRTLKLYSQSFQERRALLLATGQMNYQNWINSLEKLTLKYEASFSFYYDFIKKISEKNQMISLDLMPLVYILPGKKVNNKFIKPAEFESVNTKPALSFDQQKNLSEALIFVKNKIKNIKHSSWGIHKSRRLKQLSQLKRQIFSKTSHLQLVGFKNLSTLANSHLDQFDCKNKTLDKKLFLQKAILKNKEPVTSKTVFCSVVDLYQYLGEPKSKTYLDNYIQTQAQALAGYGKAIVNHRFAKNLSEEFLLAMVCGKNDGGVFNLAGWDKKFYSPKVISLDNKHCTFNSIRAPYARMLCDQAMSNPSNKKAYNLDNLSTNILSADFQCRALWDAEPITMPKYSVMSTYFAVKQKGKIKSYNSLAELVVLNLDPKVLKCFDQDCKQKLAQEKLENKDTSVFELWWSKTLDPQLIKILTNEKIQKQKILNTQILPALYQDLNRQNSKKHFSIIQLLNTDIASLSVMSSLKHEALVYKKIIEKIYNKHCSSALCASEFKQWSKDLSFNLNQLLKDKIDTDFSVIQKLSKVLKLSYQNLFYTMLPSAHLGLASSLNLKRKYYFTKINTVTKLSLFEEQILSHVFKALNAQIFEIESYNSLLIEREKN